MYSLLGSVTYYQQSCSHSSTTSSSSRSLQLFMKILSLITQGEVSHLIIISQNYFCFQCFSSKISHHSIEVKLTNQIKSFKTILITISDLLQYTTPRIQLQILLSWESFLLVTNKTLSRANSN